MTTLESIDALRKIASGLDRLDIGCYRKHDRDPFLLVLGLGEPSARWCFFGRDPGEQEVLLQRPFVGESGQKIWTVIRKVGLGENDVFWMNTVPFKPSGNKPWSMAVRRQCQQPLLELLSHWQGTDVVAFGEAAFRWFGITSSTARSEINQFWKRTDRYNSVLKIALELPGCGPRIVNLCAIPHPSGANARWTKSFPHLLTERLRYPSSTESDRSMDAR